MKKKNRSNKKTEAELFSGAAESGALNEETVFGEGFAAEAGERSLNKESESTATDESALEVPEAAEDEAITDEKARNAEIKRLKKVVKAEKKEYKKAQKAEKSNLKKEASDEKKLKKKAASEEKRLLKEKSKAEKERLKKEASDEKKLKKKAASEEKRLLKEKSKAEKAEKADEQKKNEEQAVKASKKTDRKKPSKNVRRVIAAVLVAAVALSGIAAWYFNPKKIPEQPKTAENSTVPDLSGAKSVLSDSFGNTLFLNSESGAFYFKSKYSEKDFLNPFSGDAAAYGKATAVSVGLTNKYGEYITLNSTDNSLIYGSFEEERLKNGISLTYTFFESAEDYENDPENGFAVRIPLTITVEGGGFKVATRLYDAQVKEGLVIENISLLPGLFAVDKNIEGNYYIIPDGSGCIADLFSRPTDEASVALPVYNGDVSCGDYNDGALIPYYSFSNGECLTTVLIDDGDALATIYYDTEIDGTCLLYSVFNVTPTVRTERGTSFGASYTGELSVVLNFQNGGEGAYNEAAFFVREFLVGKGYLSDSVAESTGDLPFIITAVGSADGKEATRLTTFEQAEEMITLLNSKGVRSVWMRFSGALSNGLLQSGVSYRSLDKMLGKTDEFIKLKSTADEKNSKLFLEADVLTGNGASSLYGGRAKANTYSELHSYTKSYSEKKSLGSSDVLRDNVSSLYKLSAELNNCNVSVNDLSFLLYGGKDKTRQEALAQAQSAAVTLSAESELMLSHPTIYLMKYATAVANVPTTYKTLSGSGLHAVPFLQSVIHGSVVYGCDFVNNGDLWNTMLKTVEYGGVPAFLFTYEDCEGLAYGNYASIAAHYYSEVKALKAVADMKITSHEEIKPGIFKTVYNYNRVVYVNYTGSVAEVEGVLLSPQDFLMV